MPAVFEITDADIAYAESILLPMGACFDEERRRFIKCLETVDLQAVPGSGKTTSLLAKILVLERHNSSSSPHGVLVISHTNAAVDEVRRKIGEVCPSVFTHPNYVGTIQSFVDRFLAIPSFIQELGFRPSRIDAEVYNAEILRRFRNLNTSAKKWVEKNSGGQDLEEFVQNLRFDSELNLTKGLGGKVLLRSAASPTYNSLAELKYSLYRSGILHFEDAFWFAEKLLRESAQLKRFLQQRFRYVFVDEMQDMAPHQHGILEAVFGPDSESDTVFQRIGDTDQAIFGGSNVADIEGWEPRTKNLTLSNSLRLSPATAKILAPFAYKRGAEFTITGLGSSTVTPHIIVYDNESIGGVLPRFARLIADLKANGEIPLTTSDPFVAVAWNSVWGDIPDPTEGKLRLIDFCPSFRSSTIKKQEEFRTLADCLNAVDFSDKTLSSARSTILRAICSTLRLCNVADPKSQRPFTPNSLMSYFRTEVADDGYRRFNQALLKWSLNLVESIPESALRGLRTNIPKLVRHLGGAPEIALDFLNGEPQQQNLSDQAESASPNLLNIFGIDISIGTVHSVKGQTHTATLYLESAYYSDGGKMYESQRLASQFRGQRLPTNAGKRVKESARMIYVGFSRPTHLLAFAVHSDRFDKFLTDIDANSWKIVKADDQGRTI
jgi:hypothetical protein